MAARVIVAAALLVVAAGSVRCAKTTGVADGGPRFVVSFPTERSAQPLDGRLLVLLSTDPSDEPRNQINLSPRTQIAFGVDVDGMRPGQQIVVDDHAFGYPVRMRDLKPGDTTCRRCCTATRRSIAPTGIR